MAHYFTVFTKHGVLLYEDGSKPSYIRNLNRSLDPRRKTQERTVQNQHVFCEIIGALVYLIVQNVNDIQIFKNEIKKFDNLRKEQDNVTTEESSEETSKSGTSEEENKEEKINLPKGKPMKKKNIKKQNEQKKGRKWDEVEIDPSLDFSEKSSNNKLIYNLNHEKSTTKKKYSFNLFKKSISKEELAQKMETYLVNKNISITLIRNLIEEVLSTFKDTVDETEFKIRLRDVIARPIYSANHDRLIDDIRKSKNVYSIMFCGVNGVGKSTSLAKMCCWLLQHNLRVYIAACDTFRAGAIEQLKVHVEAFKAGGHEVGFYESGYKQDGAGVAKKAILKAEKEGYDVILIDTAGRMHNKGPLMDSLTKIVRVNKPDYILFVGEALTGNDSLEHLREFNKAVKQGGKSISGLFVTKIDTVDTKIGQVVNMCVSGECPVLFMGTGQTNMAMEKLDVDMIVDLLMC